MQDARFDSLLQDVCRDMAAHDLAEAHRCAPRRPRKALRIAVAAAAIAALCTVGAVAVWPQVEMQRTGFDRYQLQMGTEAAAAGFAPPAFGYVPEGFTVEETTADNGNFLYYGFKEADSDAQGYVISVSKFPLDYTFKRIVSRIDYYNEQGQFVESTEDMDEEAAMKAIEDAVDSNMALTLIVESRETLTTEQMENYSIVVFPAEDGYYEVGYNPAQIENAWQIIQNIE